MPEITIDADDIFYRVKSDPLSAGLTEDEFDKASKKAIATTQRTLFRLGLSRLAKAVGTSPADLKKRRRLSGYLGEKGGVIHFNIAPVSLSAFPAAAVREVPKGFRIKKLGSSVWQRPPAAPPAGHEGHHAGFKRRDGEPDTIQKIFRIISAEGYEVADKLGDEAGVLLNKNFEREVDQIFRKKRHAK
jgi:hypothetical protein